MVEFLITSAIIAIASYIFANYWDRILSWCVHKLLNIAGNVILFAKSAGRVISYVWKRTFSGWEVVDEAPIESIPIDECPIDVRRALNRNNAVIVQKF